WRVLGAPGSLRPTTGAHIVSEPGASLGRCLPPAGAGRAVRHAFRRILMDRSDWAGVFPAITTPFRSDGAVDHGFLQEHASWLIDHGCKGLIALGSLGEAATLTREEKIGILRACCEAIADRVPVVAGISGLATAECVTLAREAERAGGAGLMILPPYESLGEAREIGAHR